MLNLQAKRAMEFMFVTNVGGHSRTHIRVLSTDEPTRDTVGKLKGILLTQKVAPIQQFQMMTITTRMTITKPLVRIGFLLIFIVILFSGHLFAWWDNKEKEHRIEFRTLKFSMLSTLRQNKRKGGEIKLSSLCRCKHLAGSV